MQLFDTSIEMTVEPASIEFSTSSLIKDGGVVRVWVDVRVRTEDGGRAWIPISNKLQKGSNS